MGGPPAEGITPDPVIIDAQFRDAARDPSILPEDIYRGRAGYNQMLAEIRESLYTQIPEARGSLEIFDHVADPDDEIQRIADSYNMTTEELYTVFGYDTYDSFKDDLHGKMIDTQLDDGRYLAIAAAWDPDLRHKDPATMTFEDIKTYARIIIHESFHGLDPWVREGEHFGSYGWIISAHANTNASEMFADVGAQAMLLRNGEPPESTFRLMTGYDAEASMREIPRYDNGPFMQRLLNEYPDGQGIQNFRLQGWRETLESVGAMRESGSPEISIEGALRKYPENLAFQQYRAKVLENLQAGLSEEARQTMTELLGGDSLEDFLDRFLDDMDFRGWNEGKYDDQITDPHHRETLQAIYDAKVEIGNWMEAHRDLFPNAARVASAIRYVTGQTDTHISEPPPTTSELSNDMLMARHWQQFKESGNELYLRTAGDFGSSAELWEYQQHEDTGTTSEYVGYDRITIVEQLFEENPHLVTAIEQGISLRDLVSLDEKDPDKFDDDEYTVVENFDEVVAAHKAMSAEPAAPANEPTLQVPLKP